MKSGILNITFACLLACMSLPLLSQPYNQALGLRGGIGATVTYKKFISTPLAIEGILGLYDYDYFGIGALFEKHTNVGNSDRFYWYWALGAYTSLGNEFSSLGITGGLGLDFSFESIPINISVDFLPRIRLFGDGRFTPTPSGGVGLRYIIDYY